MADDRKPMLTLGGLWKQETKEGRQYLSGTFGLLKIMVFANTYEDRGENSPDYVIKLAEKSPKKSEKRAEDPDEIPF